MSEFMTSNNVTFKHSMSRSHNDIIHDVSDVGRHVQHFKVYRGMSPNTSNRLEVRIKELEEALQDERETRLKFERESAELGLQVDEMGARLEELEGVSFNMTESSRRKEAEVIKLKKDLETSQIQIESVESSHRKRIQDLEKDLTEQLEKCHKDKNKSELSKQQLTLEVENISLSLESANKSREVLEGRLEELDGHLRRLQLHNDELQRQSSEFNSVKSRLGQENQDLHRQVIELDSNNGALIKAKSALQSQLDETSANLEEEIRMRNQLAIQVTNLQIELDDLSASLEEQIELTNSVRAQLQRAQQEYQQLKVKYDTDVGQLSAELEDARRRVGMRVTELEEAVEQARSRANKLEKEKLKIQVELREVMTELEGVNTRIQDLTSRLRQADQAVIEARGRAEDLTSQLQGAESERNVLKAELARVKPINEELTKKIDSLTKDNKLLSESVEEYKLKVKDQNRQIHELQAVRIELETSRSVLSDQLIEAQEAVGVANSRFESTNQLLAQLKNDTETRLTQKDEECDVIRRSGQKALEELQVVIKEMEHRHKQELNKTRKQIEREIEEYTQQNDALTRANGEFTRANKALAARVKELESLVDEERRGRELAEQSSVGAERKRVQLLNQIDELKHLLETSEKARKSSVEELTEVTSRVTELSHTHSGLTAELRRVETERNSLIGQLEEMGAARRAAEERGDRLHGDVTRIQDEFVRLEEVLTRTELARKQLEAQLRDVTVRLEQAETVNAREGKRLVARLNARMLELEAELGAEQRKSRDSGAELRKLIKLHEEIKSHAEQDRADLAQQYERNSALESKMNSLRRQLQEAEEVIGITMNKYRKAMEALEEAERHVEVHSTSTLGAGGGTGHGANKRSMSIVREVTRVVRV